MNMSRLQAPIPTDIANTLMARDYKGIGNQMMTAVMYEKYKSKECD